MGADAGLISNAVRIVYRRSSVVIQCLQERFGLAALPGAQSVNVKVEMPVCERVLLARRQPNCEWSRKADQGEHDIAIREITAECAVFGGAADDRFHELAGSGEKIWPVSRPQKGMNDVDHTNPIVQRHMHVLAQDIDSFRSGFNQCLSGADACFQHVTDNGVQKGPLVGEVPVEGPYTDAGALCYGVTRGFAADLQNKFDRYVYQSLPILLCISSHRVFTPSVVLTLL